MILVGIRIYPNFNSKKNQLWPTKYFHKFWFMSYSWFMKFDII